MKNSSIHMEDTVVIDAPLEKVFAYLTDFCKGQVAQEHVEGGLDVGYGSGLDNGHAVF